MKTPSDFVAVRGSERSLPKSDKFLKPTDPSAQATVTLIVRRRPGGPKMMAVRDFAAAPAGANGQMASREAFAAAHGADPNELRQVAQFAESRGLAVLESHQARRSVVVRGPVSAINKAFAVRLNDYSTGRVKYRSHTGAVHLPSAVAKMVESVIGLHDRPVRAKHFVIRRDRATDPPNTVSLTPQQVANLYNFPPGDGAGQTIGIYEMQTGDGPAGYAKEDLVRTMQAFGNLPTPTPIDVSIDGVANAGVSDGETGLDITVAAAVAPAAKLAVYFTGPTPQNILHAIQRMVHPDASDPQPTILSISYGWGPDDPSANSFSEQEFTQLDQLFQDAAQLNTTVLVSSGDSGAFIESQTQAQTSYPASEPWVIACGGTAIGDISGANFEEYAWNDGANGGATGGGVSARFPAPSYQNGFNIPKRNGTKKAGRGVPDVAGNASPASGYPQFVNGQAETVGGTSAVAPLYAALLARINSNLGFSAGFINPLLYSLSQSAFRDVSDPPGPANNSFNGVKGYPASTGWNACTGLGSIKGTALQNGLQAAHSAGKQKASTLAAPTRSATPARRRGRVAI